MIEAGVIGARNRVKSVIQRTSQAVDSFVLKAQPHVETVINRLTTYERPDDYTAIIGQEYSRNVAFASMKIAMDYLRRIGIIEGLNLSENNAHILALSVLSNTFARDLNSTFNKEENAEVGIRRWGAGIGVRMLQKPKMETSRDNLLNKLYGRLENKRDELQAKTNGIRYRDYREFDFQMQHILECNHRQLAQLFTAQLQLLLNSIPEDQQKRYLKLGKDLGNIFAPYIMERLLLVTVYNVGHLRSMIEAHRTLNQLSIDEQSVIAEIKNGLFVIHTSTGNVMPNIPTFGI